MAIIKITGGNNGICDYLRYGRKQDRHFTRKELDLRVSLDGNLELTEQIIDSIKDGGQNRYLHITISFRESEIPIEKLEDITRDYKELLMHAYRPEEYNFYAEAHLPKIKNSVDLSSGKKVERKPHIHIVIPKHNLLTDTVLEPTGLVKRNKEYLDAIQEYINQKHSLASPKESRRNVGINIHERVLERASFDEFKGSNKSLKMEIANQILKQDIRSITDFRAYLESNFSEVIIRNADTDRAYFAIKNEGDKKYTNLKGAIFSTDFIEKRLKAKEVPKPLDGKTIDIHVAEWKTRVSKEIKYIRPASSKLREKYKEASAEGKQELIKYREERFYENARPRTNRRQAAIKQRASHSQGRHITGTTFGVSEMHIRDMVPDFTGYEYRDAGAGADTRSKAEQSEHILREVPPTNMANWEHEEHQHHGLRRSTRGDDGRLRSENTTSSVIASMQQEYQSTIAKRRDSEKEEFKEIKLKLPANVLLKSLEATHGLELLNYSTFKAKDGSDRISDGKHSLNVSDFLTKKMHFTWNETKDYLRDCVNARNQNPALSSEERQKYFQDKNLVREYFKDLRRERQTLAAQNKQQRESSWQQFKEEKQRIYGGTLPYKQKQAELSEIIFRRLQREERIRESQKNARAELAQRTNISNFEIIQNIKQRLNRMQKEIDTKEQSTTDSKQRGPSSKYILTPETCCIRASIKSELTSEYIQQQIEQERKFVSQEGVRLITRNLVAVSDPFERKMTNYHSKDKELVFANQIAQIAFAKLEDKEQIALGIELATFKFGKELKLLGSESSQQKILSVAAERGMQISFVPQQLQEQFEELKRAYSLSNQNHLTSAKGVEPTRSSKDNSETLVKQDSVASKGTSENSNLNAQRNIALEQEQEANLNIKKLLTLNDLESQRTKEGFVQYKTSNKELAFTDKISRIEFSILGDAEKIAVGLELACAKWDKKLQVNGLDSFKQKVLEVAAEKGMNIEFIPKHLQERFEELKLAYSTPSQNCIMDGGAKINGAKEQESNTQQKEQTKQPEPISFDR